MQSTRRNCRIIINGKLQAGRCTKTHTLMGDVCYELETDEYDIVVVPEDSSFAEIITAADPPVVTTTTTTTTSTTTTSNKRRFVEIDLTNEDSEEEEELERENAVASPEDLPDSNPTDAPLIEIHDCLICQEEFLYFCGDNLQDFVCRYNCRNVYVCNECNERLRQANGGYFVKCPICRRSV